MSLIIEALKKARDDAMRRQAAARGLPLAPVPRLETRSRWLSLALIPLAAALVICVMLLIDVYSRNPVPNDLQQAVPASQPAPRAVANSSAAQISPAANNSTGGDETDPATTTTIPPSGQVEPSKARSLPSPAPETTLEDQVEPTVRSVPPTERSTRDFPAESSRPGGGSEARVAIGQAQLPGGQILDLGGIAWSESDPYALINGQVIGVGELIRSYRVKSITPDEVILEKDEDRVILRLE